MLDHEVHLIHSVELYGDHPLSEGRSLRASRPNRLCAQAQSVDDTPFRTPACRAYTRWVFYKLYGRPKVHHLIYPTRCSVFTYCPLQNSFNTSIWNLHLSTSLWVIRGRKTVSNTVLKHDFCKLIIAKVCTAITNDGTGSSKTSKEGFQEFHNNSGIVGG